MPVELPRLSESSVQTQVAPSTQIARPAKRSADADVPQDLLGAPAPKRLRPEALAFKPVPSTAPQPAELLRRFLRDADAIMAGTQNHDALQPQTLHRLSAALRRAEVDVSKGEIARAYPKALLALMEVGGPTDMFRASEALYAHLRQSPTREALLAFCEVAATWLPSASTVLVDDLRKMTDAVARHSDLSVKKAAQVLLDTFALHEPVKTKADKLQPGVIREAAKAVATHYKLDIEGLIGELPDMAQGNLMLANNTLLKTLKLPVEMREKFAKVQKNAVDNLDIEVHIQKARIWEDAQQTVDPRLVQALIGRAKTTPQIVRIDVGGGDDMHNIGVAVDVQGEMGSISILNAGEGIQYHQTVNPLKDKSRAAQMDGLWTSSQRVGDCVGKVSRLVSRSLLDRETARTLYLLQRSVFVYAHDRDSSDKTVTRAAGMEEAKRLYGPKEPRGQYVDADRRVDNIPLANLEGVLASIFNTAMARDLDLETSLQNVYGSLGGNRSVGEVFEQLQVADVRPMSAEAFAASDHSGLRVLQNLQGNGFVFVSGYPNDEYVHATTQMLTPNFNARQIAAQLQQDLVTNGYKVIPQTALEGLLNDLQAQARERGAMRLSTPPV